MREEDIIQVRGGRSRRMLRKLRQRKIAVVGFAGIAVLLLVAIFAPLLAPYDPHTQDITNVLAPPVWADGAWAYPLGTDSLGRDVLSRLIYGARSSVLISVFAMLLGATLGVITGVASGFLGRIVDAILMRLGDVQLALPFILIAIVVLGLMTNREPIHLILVLGVPAWIVYARVVRSKVLAERNKDYVQGAKVLGASKWRQMTRYVWPQVRSVVPPIALVDLSNLVIMESTLSFLGFGLTPPSISWGQILAEGRQNMVISPWLPILPGIAIMLTVLAVNLAVERPAQGASRMRRIFAKSQAQPPADSANTHISSPAGGSVSALSNTDLAHDAPSPQAAGPGVPIEHSISPPDSACQDTPIAKASETPVAKGRAAPVLQVRNLEVEFPGEDTTVRAVRGVSFNVEPGRILGIVGESGSGKSVTASAIMNLLAQPGQVTGGEIYFHDTDLVDADEKTMRTLRGKRMGMIFQNPAGSLNPVLKIGHQLIETIQVHRNVGRNTARRSAVAALREVGFGDPTHILRQYPFRLSGGQNQRVMIALTMVTEPELLLADEPTTALDVTTQAQVLDQLRRVRNEHDTSIVLISHDVGLIGEIADDVVVMYAGQVCETGPVHKVLNSPQHPYTQTLLDSIPQPGSSELSTIPGDLPDPTHEGVGCPFADRCPQTMEVCRRDNPPLLETDESRTTACHLYHPGKLGKSS